MQGTCKLLAIFSQIGKRRYGKTHKKCNLFILVEKSVVQNGECSIS
jgi:hypothetical protein